MTPNASAIVQSWLKGTLAQDHPELTPEQRRIVPLIAAGAAGEKELEAAGAEFVRAIKSERGLFRRAFTGKALLDKAVGDAAVIPWILNAETVDRDGDIIRQLGWELENYKRNPVVIWSHGRTAYADEPFAAADNVRVEQVDGVNALVADIRFAVDESEDAARRYRLAKSGFLSAGSVGFMPKETRQVEDSSERQRIGLGAYGVVFERQELLEYSLCGVPAHPGALQRAVKGGQLEEADADLYAAMSDPTERDLEKLMRKRARSFVSLSKSEEPETETEAKEERRGQLVELVAEPDMELRSILADTAKSQHRLSDSLEMLAKAITDLGNRLGSEQVQERTPTQETESTAETVVPNQDSKDAMEAVAVLIRDTWLRGLTELPKGGASDVRHRRSQATA